MNCDNENWNAFVKVWKIFYERSYKSVYICERICYTNISKGSEQHVSTTKYGNYRILQLHGTRREEVTGRKGEERAWFMDITERVPKSST